jgi:tetratricopeptide (TPR) repeat protein
MNGAVCAGAVAVSVRKLLLSAQGKLQATRARRQMDSDKRIDFPEETTMDLTPQQLGLSLYRLGRQLVERRRFEEAQESFALSLEFEPESAETCFELGNLLHAAGRHADAASHYVRAVNLKPRFPQAWYNLGVVRMLMRDLGRSRISFEQAIALKPDYAEAHNNLAILMQAAGQVEEALAHYREAAHLQPQFLEPQYNLALALQDQQQFEECVAVYERLLKRKHDHVDARNNLANVLLELGRVEEARRAYQKVLQFDSQHPEANWNLGLVQLQTGQWRAGWKNYEWRFRQPSQQKPDAGVPRWDGRRLDGRTILLTAEQGLGDMLQFFRFVPEVAALGGRILLECHAPLASMAARLPGVAGAVVKGEALPEHHFWAPLLSIPEILGIAEPSSKTPYVFADPDRIIRWKRQLIEDASDSRMRVGVIWSGNPQFKANAKRSLQAANVCELTAGREGDAVFYSLQKGVPLVPNANLVELHDGSTLEDVAAIIANLDLVISVDTSIAHLAGALAKPVWTLLAHASDWRWMTGREDSPWYPTMRLFRQRQRGDWSPVVAEVRNELGRLLARSRC